MVLEEPRVLHLDAKVATGDCLLQANRRKLSFHTGRQLSIETSKPIFTVTHILQQATPSNSATPMGQAYSNYHIPLPGPHRFVQTHESMRAYIANT